MGPVTNSLVQLVSALGGIYLLAVLLRFLLQVAKADFYNPVTQAIVKITDPVVRVFRNFVPGYRGIDFSSLLLALVIELILMFVLINLGSFQMPGIGRLITLAIVGVVAFIINIYFYAIIASIIMSLIMMFSGNMSPHPLLKLVWQLTDPVMAPVRKLIPPMGGLDFSPIVIFIAIRFVQGVLYQSFAITTGDALYVVGI